MKPRTSARIFLLDEAGRILLIRFAFPQTTGKLHFWATPGGGVEPNETPLDAAKRELREELGIETQLNGPVHYSGGIFEYEGEMVANRDVFYLARWAGSTPKLTGVTELEQKAMRELRWWSLEDLLATHETVYPDDLAETLQQLGKS